MNLGGMEIVLIVAVVLLLFGPSKLPGLGKSIGEAIRGFKKGIAEDDTKPAQVVREEADRLDTGAHSKDGVQQKEKDKQSQ